MICKILGIVDITAAILLAIYVPSVLKYFLVVPLLIKGLSSLID